MPSLTDTELPTHPEWVLHEQRPTSVVWLWRPIEPSEVDSSQDICQVHLAQNASGRYDIFATQAAKPDPGAVVRDLSRVGLTLQTARTHIEHLFDTHSIRTADDTDHTPESLWSRLVNRLR